MPLPLKPHVQALDGLRGVAISLVLIHHFGLYDRWRIGPELFFMMSGFLTTRSLQRPPGPSVASVRARVATFYLRRFLRLMPPLLVMLAVMTPVMAAMPLIDGDLWRNLVAALTQTINWQQALTPWESRSLAHLWSLASEQQFYLLWAPLVLMVPRGRLRPVLLGLAAASIVWRFWLCGQGASFGRLYFGLDTHADALVIGGLMALTRLPAHCHTALRRMGLMALVALVLVAITVPVTTPAGLCTTITITTVMTALVVASVSLGGWLEIVLTLAPLQALGRMSYSLYLWNFPVLVFFHPHWHHGLKAIQIGMVAATSWTAHVAVERPLIRYLRHHRPDPAGGLSRLNGIPPSRRWPHERQARHDLRRVLGRTLPGLKRRIAG